MEEKKITYRFVDIGHWIARCDHSSNVIELNGKEFFKLSPLFREYVWLHECVHLLYDTHDEAECNRITDKIFIARSHDASDRIRRTRFVSVSNDYGKSNSVLLTSLVCSGISLLSSATASLVAKRNSGYYSLGEGERMAFVDALLSEAFMSSLLTETQSAKDIFWSNLQPNISRKKEQSFTTWRDNNMFVDEYIEKYENRWGFGFTEITPVDMKRHPQYQKFMKIIGTVAVIAAVLVLAIVIKKNS